MNGTHLMGLEGANPLGFLAALGVQVLFEFEDDQPRLWWTDDVIPHAVVDSDFTIERIVTQAMAELPKWLESRALDPGLPPDGDVKFSPDDLRSYLALTATDEPGARLAAALVAEASFDGKGVAKPSDLYFTAGQQKFLKMARDILANVEAEAVAEGLGMPWRYASSSPSLMWDIVDDRIYALSAFNPAGEKKLTNPGPEALAILGLTRHPVFAGSERTLTQGCSGGWKRGWYTWPLWTQPAGPGAVRSLLAHATGDGQHPGDGRSRWYRSWAISAVLRSAIRRSDQGGYGTFAPPESIWSAHSNG